MRGFKLLVLSTITLCAWTAYAHEGHIHHVLGTIAAIHGQTLSVKEIDGKPVSVHLDDETKYRRGDAVAAVDDLKVGDRVAIDATGDETNFTAEVVHLAPSPAAAHSHEHHEEAGDAQRHP